MINVIVHNKENVYVAELSKGKMDILLGIRSIGICDKLEQIYLTDNKEDDIRVLLYSNSDVGTHIIKLLAGKNTLEDAIKVVHAIKNSNVEIKEELEQNIIYDQYHSIDELVQDIKKMTEELGSSIEYFYFPLCGRIDDEICEEIADSQIFLNYEADIREAIEREQNQEDFDMAQFYYGNESVQKKLISAAWSVKKMNNELYGYVEIRLREELTDNERESLKYWIPGQNSDGLGESFEQHPIYIEEGDLYISFWSADDDYFVYDSNEMHEYLSKQYKQQMGGM